MSLSGYGVDALDATIVMGGWTCPICSIEVPKEATYCNVCRYSRPMDRRGIPQIFSGYAIHFNGIIPRTLKHPSHAVEWRIAERHGAVCIATFDPVTVNLLLYRPGYERSDKVRLCVEKHTNIPCVPITWMLDSLLQSRQIHPTLYRLTSVPAVAQPTVRDTALPHHQHPYYQINADEYAIPTSFPPARKPQAKSASVHGSIPTASAAQMVGAQAALPRITEVAKLQWTNVGIWKATCDAISRRDGAKNMGNGDDDEDDEVESMKNKCGIDIIASQQKYNKVDKMLFSGMHFLLSESLVENELIISALRGTGAQVSVPPTAPSALTEKLQTDVSHVLYDHGDKKGDVMIHAANVKKTCPGLVLVQSIWAEDCLMLGEVVPVSGPYVPTAKLLETLQKKLNKREA